VTAFLTLLAAMLLALAAIGEVRGAHRSRHAGPSPRCWQRRTDHQQQDLEWRLIRCFMTGHWRLLRQPAMLIGLQIVKSIRNAHQLLIRARRADADIAAIQ
jgi:hypothetical protein